MIHRKESATEIAMRLRLGLPPLRPLVWIESIDAIAAAAREGRDVKQARGEARQSGAKRIAQTQSSPKDHSYDRS